MNRIIKFRARDTKKNKWLTAIPPMEYMLDSNAWDRRDCDDGSGENILFFPANPMGPDFDGRIVYQQFTEFKDWHGKECYEGDIIQVSGYAYLDEIYWEKGHWRPLVDTGSNGGPLDSKYLEIVSNIFEFQNDKLERWGERNFVTQDYHKLHRYATA